DDAASNTIESNQVERNGNSFSATPCAGCFGGGILVDVARNNMVRSNHIRNNGNLNGADNTDGIRVNQFSGGNTIQDNHLKNNETHDCHDNSAGTGTALTANYWIDNRGETSMPPT